MRRLYLIFLLYICFAGTSLAQQQTLKAAFLTELTGAGAVIGEDCRRGIETGRRAFLMNPSAAPIITFGDTRDDAASAISEFNKLVQHDKAQLVFLTRSKIALPLSPIAERLSIPLIGGVGHPDFLNGSPHSIRLFPNAAAEGRFLADKAVELALKRISIVTLQDEWNVALSSAFRDELRRLKAEVVSDIELLPGEQDLSPPLMKLRNDKSDAIFVNVLLAQAGPLIKKLRQFGLKQKLLSNYWIQVPQTVETAGAAAVEGALFAQVDTSKPKFQSIFSSLFPAYTATPAVYLCYAAVAAIKEIQDEWNSKGEPLGDVVVRDRIVELLDGELRFQNREAQLELVLKALRDGKPVETSTQ